MKAQNQLVNLLDKYYCHDLYELYDEMTEAIHDRHHFPEGLHIWHSLSDTDKLGYYLSITDKEVKEFKERLIFLYSALN